MTKRGPEVASEEVEIIKHALKICFSTFTYVAGRIRHLLDHFTSTVIIYMIMKYIDIKRIFIITKNIDQIETQRQILKYSAENKW